MGQETAVGVRDGRAAVPTFTHVPALDGLRAVAVVAVLAFHAEAPGARGGYLGVSLFFTLSGFLMGALALREHEIAGSISLARFWERRARRLLPGALATIGVVALVARTTTVFDRTGLRADLGAALAYVANWRFAAAERSYAALFEAPSPVQHFWSLAIEEQFYLVFPLVVVALSRVGRGRRGVVAAGLGVLAAASVAAQLLTDDADLAYYGTHTRAAELLAGALVACAVVDRRTGSVRAPGVHPAVGFAALAGFAALVTTAPSGGEWITGGGAVTVVPLAVALVVAALAERGPFAAALGAPGPAAIGRVSYGLYLYHWPVFLALDARRTGLDGPALVAVRIAVTVTLAVVSYHLVECPIRFGRVLRRPRALVGTSVVAAVATLVAVGAVPVAGNRVVLDTAAFVPGDGARAAVGAPRPAPLRVMVVGDSTGRVAAEALAGRDDMIVLDATRPGCPLLASTVATWHPEDPPRSVAACADARERRADALRLFRPQVVVVMSSVEDVGVLDEVLRRPEVTGVFDAYRAIVGEYEALIGELRATGAVVAWADIPRYTFANRPDLRERMALDLRVDGFNWAISQATGAALGAVTLEYAAALDRPDGTVDLAVRPDGIHLRARAAAQAARGWLAQALRVALREGRVELGMPEEFGDDGRLRVLVVGDSTSLAMATGLADHARVHRDLVVDWAGQPGCPLLPAVEVRIYREPAATTGCEHPAERWPARARRLGADVVVVFSSFMDVMDVRLADGRWTHVGEPAFDALYVRTVDDVLAELSAQGLVVAWADAPAPLGMERGVVAERLAALNRIVAQRAAAWPRVVVVPFAGRVAQLVEADPEAARAARPDGVHFTANAATGLAGWLVDAIEAAVEAAQAEAPVG